MNHKGEIGFVKTHAQRGGRHQNLHAVLQQRIFQFHSTFASLSAVRLRLNALRLKPTCHLHRVAHGERVNDAAALDIRQVGCQPTHPFGLTRDADGLKQERRSSELAARDGQIRSKQHLQIGENAVIGSGRCGEDAKIRRQRTHDALYKSIMWAEVVAPVRNAMRLVHHQQ